MKFTINFEKKHLYFLSVFVVILSIFTIFAAQPFDPVYGWHPLQQITVDESGAVSVDANFNGVIDNAEVAADANALSGLTLSNFCQSDGTNCPSFSGSPWTISGANILYSGGNVQASLFQDLDNGNYYVNPASTSVLNGLNVNSISAGSISASSASFNSLTVAGKQAASRTGSGGTWTQWYSSSDTIEFGASQYICGFGFRADCDFYSSDDGCIRFKLCTA